MSLPGYKLGTQLAFVDANATISDGASGMHTGMVNGPPLTDEAGNVLFVPIFATRDNGREATTILVAVANIVGPVPA